MPFNIGVNPKKYSVVLVGLLLLSVVIPAMQVSATFTRSKVSSIAGELVRSPVEVHSRQTALIFAHIPSVDLKDVKLEVAVTLDASLEPAVIDLPSLPTVTYTIPMLPVSWAPDWYVTAIIGLPAETRDFEYKPPIGPSKNVTFTLGSRVNYKLLVDGNVVAEDGYMVLEGGVTRLLPPLVVATVYDALHDRSLINETFGLGPKGWTIGAGEPLKAFIMAIDDKGIKGITNLTFEYKVEEGPWIRTSLSEDVLMQSGDRLTEAVNSLIQKVEEAIRKIKPDFEIPEALLPAVIGQAEIPEQYPGACVMFRANATDVDGNASSSPMGFYYVVNKGNSTKILVVDPHVRLWLLQVNLKQLTSMVEKSSDYQMPEDVMNSLAVVSRVSDAVVKYGVGPFHHWERLGRHYDLYIAWPNQKLVDLMKTEGEGGYEPHVIVLSNLWLGYKDTSGSDHWNWDLKDVEVDGKSVLEHLINYVRERHAGVIATHGTLSDEIVWLDCKLEAHYKVGTRGHVGNVPADVEILDEKTVAALLGMPELALWEYLRDKVAEALCAAEETKPIGLAVGSTPLQVPNVPWNGTLRATPEAGYVGWSIPDELTVTIPSVHSEFGFSSYTQVGWQLGMPRGTAYAAWWKVNETRPLARQIYGKLSMFVENVTSSRILHGTVSEAVDKALQHRLRNFYGSVASANITDVVFNLTVTVPELEKTFSMSMDIGRQAYETILRLLPVKIVALSPDCTAAVIVYDKYWDSRGYRSVYFSFEVEAAEGETAETLLVNAVEWALKWQYKNATDLLGGMVRVSKELATRFNDTFAGLPGNPMTSKGLVLNEEGYAKMELLTNTTGTLHILIAHPTSDEIKAKVLEGPARIINITEVAEGLTLVMVETTRVGNVMVGLRAGSQSALNPAYVSIKQEKAPPLKPAEFRVTELSVSPVEAQPGETVIITVKVTNVGEKTGSHTVELKVAGVTAGSKTVTMAGGESTSVTFEVVRDVAGTYSVEVDGQTGSFVVKEVAAPQASIEAWLPYVGITVTAIIVATIVILKKKK